MFTVVSIKQRYGGHAKQAGLIASQCRVGAYAGKFVVVVDDDIDVTNLDEVMWAVSTRCDPASSIEIVTNAWSTPLDPSISPKNREARGLHQFAGYHRRLPSLCLARQVPEGEHADPGSGQEGLGQILVSAEVTGLETAANGDASCGWTIRVG